VSSVWPSRLIPAAPLDRDAVASAFEALATKIQRRDHVDRVTALQRAVDEHPARYEEYVRAFGR
jgi:predicted LPLAT superfamily acyltransferase